MLSKQFGDLAEFIVVAGEVDGVGPPLGTTTLRSYFERLAADDPDASSHATADGYRSKDSDDNGRDCDHHATLQERSDRGAAQNDDGNDLCATDDGDEARPDRGAARALALRFVGRTRGRSFVSGGGVAGHASTVRTQPRSRSRGRHGLPA